MSIPHFEHVRSNFTLPFMPFPFQEDRVINHLGPLDTSGFYLDMGTGKTLTSTYKALGNLAISKIDRVIVTMPPILLEGWHRFLSKIPEITAGIYQGTPRQRESFDLGRHDFTLMSMPIFKRDYEHICNRFRTFRVELIVDEAQSVKNIESDNHKKVHEFKEDVLDLLTGTPLSTPLDGYAFCKLVAPGCYRNFNQFKNIHVAEVDFFKHPKEWQHLDLLAKNMQINAARVLRTEVLEDLPEVTYQEIPYLLDHQHLQLYRKLAEERLLLLSDGGKIDATTPPRLYNALQQVVLNWAHFSGDPSKRSRGYELVEEALDETNGKLIVCANYRMTNEGLYRAFAKFNPVIAYGGQDGVQNRRAVDRFVDEPGRRLFIMQPSSAGIGTDGLQHVCRDMLFVECPVIPLQFHQAVARLWRQGARDGINVKIGNAQGTIQTRLMNNMLGKDDLIGQVMPNIVDLRRALYGEA